MSVALYQRIAEDLVLRITNGTIAVGSLLPTELQLMEHYGASRNTVRSALTQLQDMGLISRKRNRGTMVEALPSPGAFTQSLSTLDDLVSFAKSAIRHISASKEVVMDIAMSREFGCPPGSRWMHIAMTRRESDNSPALAWTDAYVDAHYTGIRRLAAKYPDQLLCDLIESNYGRRIATVHQTISAGSIDATLAEKLAVSDSSPCMKIVRQYRDPASVLVLATRSIYPADRYQLSTKLVRST